MRKLDLQKLNPFAGLDDEPGLAKLTHIFHEGDRVQIHEPHSNRHTHGHRGVITTESGNHFFVRLDSGEEVHAHESELIPEGFPLAPVAAEIKILKAAIASGAVSVHDQLAIESAFEKIESGSYAMGPFGEMPEDSSSPFHTLRVLAEKHQASDTSDMLSKRAKSDNFQVGDLVIDKASKRKGKITRLDVTHADIDYGNGTTGICLHGYFEAA